jgi:hypothetical protein
LLFWLLKPSLDQLVDCLGCSWAGIGRDEGKKARKKTMMTAAETKRLLFDRLSSDEGTAKERPKISFSRHSEPCHRTKLTGIND